MSPAAEKLAVELDGVTFRDPRPPVITNVEARPNSRGDRIGELLRLQVTAPVRFTEMIQQFSSLGVTHVLEVGPGRVLTGLVARVDRKLERAGLGSVEDLDEVRGFLDGLAR
jgi:[acyl-carrier-protein] S-malonyltransferase